MMMMAVKREQLRGEVKAPRADGSGGGPGQLAVTRITAKRDQLRGPSHLSPRTRTPPHH